MTDVIESLRDGDIFRSMISMEIFILESCPDQPDDPVDKMFPSND
jgi:hypothetical protein